MISQGNADANTLFNYLFNYYVRNCNKIMPILKIANLYNTFGNITSDNYKLLYSDDDYTQNMKIANNYFKNNNSIFGDLKYIFGFAIAIYLLDRYKTDKSFINNIIAFNKALKTSDEWNLIQLIGLKDIQIADINKIKTSYESILAKIKHNNENQCQ